MSKPQYHFWYSETRRKATEGTLTATIGGREVVYTSWSNRKVKPEFSDSVYLGMGFMHKINGRVQDE